MEPHLTRRNALTAITATGAALAGMSALAGPAAAAVTPSAATPDGRRPSPRRIDTHQHIVPPSYAAWLAGLGVTAGGLAIPAWSAPAALAMMDSHGIETGILSLSTPQVFLPGHGEEAAPRAREVNDFTAGVVREAPSRFGFFAVLPVVPSPGPAGPTITPTAMDAVLAELAHAYDVLGADGVILLANTGNLYLGDPAYEPLMAALEARAAVVFVHPNSLALAPVPGLPPFLVDFLLDTTRAAVNLVAKRVTTRYPSIRFVLAHGGGFLPYAAERIAGGPNFSAAGFSFAEVLEQLRTFWFDTALTAGPEALPSLLAFARPDHVLFGTDFPYAPPAGVDLFTANLDAFPLRPSVRRSINRGAAEQLFPRLATPRS